MLEKSRSNSVISYETEIKLLREKITSLEFNHKIEINKLKNIDSEKMTLISNLENTINQKNEKINFFEKTLKNNQNFQLIREMEEKLGMAEKKIIELEKKNINKTRSKRTSTFSIENNIKKKLDKQKSFTDIIDKSFNMLDNLKIHRKRRSSSGFDNNMELNLFSISEAEKKKNKILKNNQYEIVIENLQKIISDNDNIRNDYEDIIQQKNQEIEKFFEKIENLENNFVEAEEFKGMLINDLDDLKIILENKNNEFKELKNKFEKMEDEFTIAKTINSQLDLKLKIFEKEKFDLKNKIYEEKDYFRKNSILFQEQAIVLKNNNKEKEKDLSDLKTKLENLIYHNQEYENKLEKVIKEKEKFETFYKENFQNMEHKYRLENSNLQDKIIELKKINVKQTVSSFSDIKKKNENKIEDNLESLQIGIEMLSEGDEFDNLVEISDEDSEDDIRERIKSKITINHNVKKILCLSKDISEDNLYEQNLEEKDKVISDLKSKFNEYICKIEEKDFEIQKLRKICIGNEEKKNFISLENFNNEINLLKMDIEHLKTNELISKENWEKKEKILIKEFDEMTNNCLNAKLKHTEILSEMDSLKMAYSREIRKLKYKIELYEKEIDNFNNRILSKRKK